MPPHEPAEPDVASAATDVMGGTARVVAIGARDEALERATLALAVLERRWSRFRTDSELSRLNAAGGRPVVVSEATATLVTLAVRGWSATAGAFDPTVLDAVTAAGYDRSFDQLVDGHRATAGTAGVPGCAAISVDPRSRSVLMPPGVHLDAGGIGKGLAADLVAAMLRADGARGALVDVGGDIRVSGDPPAGAWRIAAELPGGDVTIALHTGAVATSSVLRRRWRQAGVERHHLIDPRTGAPATHSFVAATVIAGSAWWAEVLTKAVMLADTVEAADRLLRTTAAAGIVVGPDGRRHHLADVDSFLP